MPRAANRARPVLARVLERIDKGDTLVVVRIDRLARSLSHLLEVIERLEAKGAFLPLDTGPYRYRIPAGQVHVASAGGRGRVRARPDPGTHQGRPCQRSDKGPRRREPWAAGQGPSRSAQSAAGTTGRLHGAFERDGTRLGAPRAPVAPPTLAWEDVVRIINGPLPEARRWTQKPPAARCEGPMSATASCLPRCWPAPGAERTDDRLPAIIAGIKGADPDITLQAICTRLESMRERTPRGRTSWQPSSVKMLAGAGREAGAA